LLFNNQSLGRETKKNKEIAMKLLTAIIEHYGDTKKEINNSAQVDGGEVQEVFHKE